MQKVGQNNKNDVICTFAIHIKGLNFDYMISVKMSLFKKAYQQHKQFGYEKLKNPGCCESCSCGCVPGQEAIRDKQRIEDKAEEKDLRKEFENQLATDLQNLKIEKQGADKKQQDEVRNARLMKFN